MDDLPFPDEHFDLVMTSMALHATPPPVRREAVREAARVVRQSGAFLIVDWGRPRFGVLGLFMLPFVVRGEANRDNWSNVYPELCEQQGLLLAEDRYLNSIARRQVFRRRQAD